MSNTKRLLQIKMGIGLLGILIVLLIWGVVVDRKMSSSEKTALQKKTELEYYFKQRVDVVPKFIIFAKEVVGANSPEIADVEKAKAAIESIKLQTDDDWRKLNYANAVLGMKLYVLTKKIHQNPKIAANKDFKNVELILDGAENRIALRRQDYQKESASFSRLSHGFPGALVAKIRGKKDLPN